MFFKILMTLGAITFQETGICALFGLNTYQLFVIILFSQLCYFSGTRIKTRKRNIAAPLDPAAFSDAVVQIYLDNAGDLVLLHFCISVLEGWM